MKTWKKVLVLVFTVAAVWLLIAGIAGKWPFGREAAQAVEPTAMEAEARAEDLEVRLEALEAEKAVVEEALQEKATPIEVAWEDLPWRQIMQVVVAHGWRQDAGDLFGDTWALRSGPVEAKPREGYEVMVFSSDPASVSLSGEALFSTDRGFRLVTVGAEEVAIDVDGYQENAGHRPVSGWAIPLPGSVEDEFDFAVGLAAYEVKVDRKPDLFVWVGDELYRVETPAVFQSYTEAEMEEIILTAFNATD